MAAATHAPPASTPRRFRIAAMPSAPDQSNISACAVNACATALQMLVGYKPSRMFMYYNTRRHVMGAANLHRDTGCTLRDVCKAVAWYGACTEGEWPYIRALLADEPPRHVYENARRMTPEIVYRSVPSTLGALVTCMLDGLPVMMGMSVSEDLGRVARDGLLPMPAAGAERLGAHAVLACGYDLDSARILMQNCWGDGWGNHGFFEAPFEFVLDRTRCWDMWVMSLARKKC